MDAATLQARIYAGYAKAAQRIGYTTSLYRPTAAANPVGVGTLVQTMPASFNPEDMGYSKPNKYGHPTWYGVFDGRLTKVGDYLINANDGTFFVAAQQQALPILLVQCNRTLNVIRPQQQAGVGALGYGGDTAANETTLMTAWPASVLQGPKGEKSEVGLPGDVKQPWWAVLMPAWAGVTIRGGDILADDLGRRYVVSSAELTDLGWRMTAMQAQT
jgi:hypothetical protein